MAAVTQERHSGLLGVRRGISLVEIVVVIAIVGVLISLCVPAVQKIRSTALQTKCSNQMKQVALAAHNFASTRGGRMPSPYPDDAREGPFFASLVNFIGRGELIAFQFTFVNGQRYPEYYVRLFQCPADRTAQISDDSENGKKVLIGDCSYAANWFALRGGKSVSNGFPDGTSTTLLLTEHYARCSDLNYFMHNIEGITVSSSGETKGIRGARRATFADEVLGDVVPPVGNSEIPTVTFQIAPSDQDCNPAIPQSHHVGTMIISMIDGSVRALSATVSPRVFWSAVSADGGEVLGGDW